MRHRWKAALAAILVAGCTGTAGPSPSGADGTASPSTGGPTASAAPGWKIGATVLGTQFPAVVAQDEGFAEAVEAAGGELVLTDSQARADKQVSDIDDLLTQGIDGLLVNAVDANAVLPPVQRALDQGVPVVASFTTLGDAECAYPGTVAFVGFDEQGFGRLTGQKVLELLPDGGSVVILEGLAGVRASEIRKDVFVETIAANPAIEVVASQPGNFDRDTSRTVMSNILQAQPSIDVVYAADDNMAIGAVQAIEAAGRIDEIDVIGLGGFIEGLKAIEEGRMAATVFSSLHEGGRLAAGRLIAHLDGDDSAGDCIKIPQVLVDSSNIAEYKDKGEF